MQPRTTQRLLAASGGVMLAALASASVLAPAVERPVEFPAHPLWPQGPAPEQDSCEMLAPPEVDRGLWQTNLWPGGIVFYDFDPAVTQQNRDRTRVALDEISTFANVTFVPRTSEPNYVRVQNGTGNSSFVGQIGGAQALNMVSWSSRYVICHEFFHALGQWHHHQRFDRDTYVAINTANIQSGREHNFTLPSGKGLNVVGPYNFSSIMHYSRCAFSNCPCPSTCTVIDPAPGFEPFAPQMGNRSFMSQGDKDAVIAKYGAAIDDASEPNDSLAEAVTIGQGTASFRLYDNDDFFSVHRGSPGRLTVRFSAGVWSSANVTLSILSGTGATLVSGVPVAVGTGYEVTVEADVPAGASIVRTTRVQPWGGGYDLTITTPACLGDLNSDNAVNTADLTAFLGSFGQTVPARTLGDLNGDAVVNVLDLTIFLGLFGSACP